MKKFDLSADLFRDEEDGIATEKKKRKRASALKFTGDHTTDAKRFVRHEHLLHARSVLRVRDAVHNAPYRIMMLAGGSPREEILSIREKWTRAHIVAVDRDPRCVDLAREAGADEAFVVADVCSWANPASRMPVGMEQCAAFDCAFASLRSVE